MHKDESIYRKDSLLNKHKDNSMHKGKSIWGIAIRSSIIAFLGGLVVVFALLILLEILSLEDPLVSSIGKSIGLVGILHAQRSYKATYHQMTYGQGVKVGFLTVFFMALWVSLSLAGMIAWYGKEVIPNLLGGAPHPSSLQEPPAVLALFYEPLGFLLIIFSSFLIGGTLSAVISSLFLKTKNKDLGRQQVVD
jgi:hypothetical protein